MTIPASGIRSQATARLKPFSAAEKPQSAPSSESRPEVHASTGSELLQQARGLDVSPLAPKAPATTRDAPVVTMHTGAPGRIKSLIIYLLTLQGGAGFQQSEVGPRALGDVATFPELYRDLFQAGMEKVIHPERHAEKYNAKTLAQVFQGHAMLEGKAPPLHFFREAAHSGLTYNETALSAGDPREMEKLQINIGGTTPLLGAKWTGAQELQLAMDTSNVTVHLMRFTVPGRQDAQEFLDTVDHAIASGGNAHFLCKAIGPDTAVQCPGGPDDYGKYPVFNKLSQADGDGMFNIEGRLKASGQPFALVMHSRDADSPEQRDMLERIEQGLGAFFGAIASLFLPASEPPTPTAVLQDYLIRGGHGLIDCVQDGEGNITISTPHPVLLQVLQRYAARHGATCELRLADHTAPDPELVTVHAAADKEL